jgi:hypothetical protein
MVPPAPTTRTEPEELVLTTIRIRSTAGFNRLPGSAVERGDRALLAHDQSVARTGLEPGEHESRYTLATEAMGRLSDPDPVHIKGVREHAKNLGVIRSGTRHLRARRSFGRSW